MKISVLLPTRGRVNALITAIRSLLDNFSHENDIEILLRFDEDDLDTVEKVKKQIGDEERVHFCVGQKYGYAGSHRYLNELSASARGDWLMLFNDDAIMETKNWDKEIEKYIGQMVFLDTVKRDMQFPIIPRKVFEILGHFSLSTHCDTWIWDIAEMLKIRSPTSISILHDRADLTGNNRDVTFETSQKQYMTDYRNPRDEALRAKDALLLKNYIEGLCKLHVRSRKDGIIEHIMQWDLKKTAIIICDMWDSHWCKGASERIAEMASRINQVVANARALGALIIHCPSDTMRFYENTSQYKLAQSAPPAPYKNFPVLETQLPIDMSDNGCDDLPQCTGDIITWKRQIDTIEIGEHDAITDSINAYYLMRQLDIENVVIMGVHTNCCILNRPFGIRQLISQRINVVLMRDLTDSIYNSRMPPYVNHFVGTDLVIEYIERYLCPTITSVDFIGGKPFHFKNDSRYSDA